MLVLIRKEEGHIVYYLSDSIDPNHMQNAKPEEPAQYTQYQSTH